MGILVFLLIGGLLLWGFVGYTVMMPGPGLTAGSQARNGWRAMTGLLALGLGIGILRRRDGPEVAGGAEPDRPDLPVLVPDVEPTSGKAIAAMAGTSLGTVTRSHRGQRKLFLSEMAALVRILEDDPEGAAAPLRVVYAGAAPGQHQELLLRCFPRITLDLYDPRPIDPRVAKDPRVQTHLQMFTDADAERLADEHVDVFISDIRLERTAVGADAWEATIAEDMEAQARWANTIRARRGTLLKMHMPWAVDRTAGETLYMAELRAAPDTAKARADIAEASTGTMAPQDAELEYLDGADMLQVYAPVGSHETRLLLGPPPEGGFPVRMYGLAERNDRLDAFNVLWREKHDYDRRRERAIWAAYLELDKVPKEFAQKGDSAWKAYPAWEKARRVKPGRRGRH